MYVIVPLLPSCARRSFSLPSDILPFVESYNTFISVFGQYTLFPFLIPSYNLSSIAFGSSSIPAIILLLPSSFAMALNTAIPA